MKHRIKKRQPIVYLTVVALTALLPINANADTLFTADDARFNYYGRFDFSDPSAPRWNWSGSTIEARFSGTTVGIALYDGAADYDIEIDGVVDTVIRTQSATVRYDITVDSDTMHLLRIMQRSETHTTAATFRGLYLPEGKSPGDAPAKPSRKIEFIGNSDLVAYGVESTASNCNNSQLRKTTNTNLSYGALVARAFHAQRTILGWSGKGIVRNSDSPGKRSSENFPAYYDKTLGSLDGTWDFSQWIPDLVVIELGWNDFSSNPRDETKYPDDTMFIGDYHKFIGTIRSHYPDAAILCVTTHIGNLVSYIKRVVTEETTSLQRQKVYFAEYPPDASFTLTGCHGHPSPDDHRLIAQMLIDTIRNTLGWDTVDVDNTTGISRPPGAIAALPAFKEHSLTNSVSTVIPETTGARIRIYRIDGSAIRPVNDVCPDRTSFSSARLPPGVYLAGTTATGWKRFAVLR